MNDFNIRLSVDSQGNITVTDESTGNINEVITNGTTFDRSNSANIRVKRDGKKTTIIIEDPIVMPRSMSVDSGTANGANNI